MKKVILKIQNLVKKFPLSKNKLLIAVDDVTLEIYSGETLGLVGESGSGKSTIGKIITRIHEPTSGSVFYDGKSVSQTKRKAFSKKVQMIFQDPYASLNPRMKVADIIGEGLDIHRSYKDRKERTSIINGLIEKVGLNLEHANRFPHEFSGGQRQRIGIARALALNPDFVVCDEPISALDVSIQAQIVNLLKDLQINEKLTYLFISHDLSMVKYISDRIAVMYLGEIVELSDSQAVTSDPLHPYTRSLIDAIPVPDPNRKGEIKNLDEDEINASWSETPGCKFSFRCPHAMEKCKRLRPKLVEVKENHFVSCHLYEPKQVQ